MLGGQCIVKLLGFLMKDGRGNRRFEDWVLPRDGGSRAEATEDKFLLMGLDDASNRGGERVVGTDGAP